ncbi:class I SAM-dependent methyltransferase [Chitinophaga niabensis]|uniref:Methyltransferase domain-containing protein n=1 Tax=Chitinophaga niabensis TaxID=536979 RepID=A0A1N6JXT6_9BACT|nr:class I SAM-dependent methyltransferase [Chitinophaga niabensis]SIO49148.1 Methyltransferase domain-containing protein [Chitinophaga niabensis]
MHSAPLGSQKKAFQEYEANQWFGRNRSVLETYSPENDVVVNTLKNYHVTPKKVLEIGSSAGYRLNGIKETFRQAEVFGLDPSQQAIDYGTMHYPDVQLFTGTADNMQMFEDGQFDLVIVGFVFYVIDRHLLLKVVAEIDRVLADKGTLVAVDFFSEKAIRNHYEHITQFEAFSFKQNYDQIFTASQLYQLVHKGSFHHSSKEYDATDDYYNKCSVTMLKKDVYAAYK